MKIFLDTADLQEIKKYRDMGIIDGVTTNPTILSKFHTTIEELICYSFPMPLSLEVTTNVLEEMITQAKQLHEDGGNVVVKIPVENQFGIPCYGVIHELELKGVKVNATVCLSFGQVMLAAKAGATYISIFAGRIGDEGGNPNLIIEESVAWLKRWDYKSEIIVGSIRSVRDVLESAMAGAHIITIPPEFLAKIGDNKMSRETVRQFMVDAKE